MSSDRYRTVMSWPVSLGQDTSNFLSSTTPHHPSVSPNGTLDCGKKLQLLLKNWNLQWKYTIYRRCDQLNWVCQCNTIYYSGQLLKNKNIKWNKKMLLQAYLDCFGLSAVFKTHFCLLSILFQTVFSSVIICDNYQWCPL